MRAPIPVVRGAAGLLVFTVLWLAGCSDPEALAREPAAEAVAEGLVFSGVYDVGLRSVEPEEERGFIRVQWQGGLFAVDNEKEWDVPRHAIVDGDVVYTTRSGHAWVRWDLPDGVASGRLTNRLVLWDVPRMLAHESTGLELREGVLVATVRYPVGKDTLAAEVRVEGEGPDIRVESAQGRESPYTLHPGGEALRFPVQAPARVLPAAEVDQGDAAARTGHQAIADLVLGYCRTHGGLVPESVDPDTLRVERVTSGTSWPASPYDDQPMRDAPESGHFMWERTSPTQGVYEGRGWDGAVVKHFFGPTVCRP